MENESYAAVAAGIAAVNLLTYALYARDKRASREGGWRVPEATLLMLALLGGSPAALVASRRLRHKTKKLSFRLRLIAIILLQVFALAGVAMMTAL